MIQSTFDQVDIHHFTSFFKDFGGQTGWLIKIHGQAVKLNSGKSLWKTKAHARNALRNHLRDFRDKDCFIRQLNIKYLESEYSSKENELWKNFLAFAEEKGILEFAELK